MDIIQQFFLSLVLIIGIVIGESLATKSFGRPKQRVLFFFELAVFVLVIVLSTSTLQYMPDIGFIPMLAINAMIGVISAILSRGVSTGIGFVSTMPQQKPFQKYTTEEKMLQNVIQAMCDNGFKRDEITKTLVGAGYNKKEIDSLWSLKKFKTKSHPLLKQIAKLEEKVRELENN